MAGHGHKQHHHGVHHPHKHGHEGHPVMTAAHARSKHAKGGKVEPKNDPGEDTYAGKDSDVKKEAEEKAKGGRIKVKRAAGGPVAGKKTKMRLDRPGRKRGGGVGADKHPLTSASKIRPAEGHTTMSGNAEEGP